MTNIRNLSLLLVLCLANLVQAAVVTKTNSNGATIDGNGFSATSALRTVEFTAADFGGDPTIIVDVDIAITFAKEVVDPLLDPFAYFNEIEFVLTSPGGKNFTLISNAGGTELVPFDSIPSFDIGNPGAGFSGTVVFDQSAAAPVNTNPNEISAGTFRPDDDTLNSLDYFNGDSAVGTWTLFMEDDFGPLYFPPFPPLGSPSPLVFTEFSLTITTASASSNPIPEPSSLLIFGLGIGAIVGGHWLRRRPCFEVVDRPN